MAARRAKSGGGRIVILASILAFALGGSLALLVARDFVRPEWSEVSSTGSKVDVTVEPFFDQRELPAKPIVEPAWDGASPMSGVVRASKCVVGSPIESGSSPFKLNDAQVVALNLASPLWRDLGPGMKGDDVWALQSELQRLGFLSAEPDGDFGVSTGEAVGRLWASVEADGRRRDVPVSQVLWIPAASVVPSECAVRVGDQVGQGAPLFSTGGGLTAVTVERPSGDISAARSLVQGDVASPIPPDGTVSDPSYLEALAKSSKYIAYQKDPSSALKVESRLDEPIEVAVIPAAALYDIDASSACVLGDDGPVLAQIVASQFGNTLVRLSEPTQRVVLAPAKDTGTCR